MPDTGTGAALAAAASGATTAVDGAEGSRHRHRTQQGDAERPDPGAAPPPASSGVLGECALDNAVLWRKREQVNVMLGNETSAAPSRTSRHRSFVSTRASQNYRLIRQKAYKLCL